MPINEKLLEIHRLFPRAWHVILITGHFLNPMVFPDETSTAAGEAGAPVFGGLDLFQFVGLVDVGEALVD